jgi:3-deoxy-manno-octulosonate cytidylyltransferase (CMP-KDO synthetase)
MRTAILIPARLESKRYPNKPLVELNGIPMIKKIFDICNQTDYDTYVVTDSEEIASQVPNYVMTGKASNGTERCAMAAKQLNYGNFVNVQGDMPDITTKMIDSVVEYLKYYPIATLYADMPKIQQDEPSTVKMVRAGDKALWFGRGMTGYGEWHLGIYAYRNDALNLYPSLEITQEEKVEKLEQLRWLKAGWEIGCTRVDFDGIEINTKEDLRKWITKNERPQNN